MRKTCGVKIIGQNLLNIKAKELYNLKNLLLSRGHEFFGWGIWDISAKDIA